MPAPSRTDQSHKGAYTGLATLVVVAIVVVIYLAGRGDATATQTVATVDTMPPVPTPDAQGSLYGKADAPVIILEFGDFSCPACATWSVSTAPVIRQRMLDSGQARLIFHDFVLGTFPNSAAAHNAAACVGEQGKFWDMHDRLYHDAAEWTGVRDPSPLFAAYARDAEIDMARWQQCYDTRKYATQIEANTNLGKSMGVGQTPTFIISEKKLDGPQSYDSLKKYVDLAAKAMGP